MTQSRGILVIRYFSGKSIVLHDNRDEARTCAIKREKVARDQNAQNEKYELLLFSVHIFNFG